MSGAAPPSHLGKYAIRAVLGRGAMGIVYDGWDPVIDRRVAIKTVRLPDAHDQEAIDSLDRFKREAQAAGRLTHPNVVGVFDYGETDEVAYIVMEFVEGRSLKQVLDANLRLPATEAVRIMADVLAGLAYSHGRGVIHRDIKPANIMITTEEQAKIADFGIARIEASSMTQAGTVMGTPAYMSPEQFMGQPVDARTDIYSCGIMLYQLLAGERPYEGSMTSIMHKAMTTTPPRPSELTVTAPAALDPVVARAMARRPEDRFASATEFAHALRDSANAPAPNPAPPPVDADATIMAPRGPAPAAPPPVQQRPAPATPPAKPDRTPLILGGSLAIIAAAGAAFFFLRPAPEQPTTTPATPAPQAAVERPAPTPTPAPTATPSTGTAALPAAPTPVPATPPSASAAAKPELPPITAAPAAPPEAVPPASAPTPETPLPSARPAPQQQAAVVPPPVVLPPPVTAPAPVPAMAAPPPDPASIPCSLVQPGTSLTDAANAAAIRQAGVDPRIVDQTFCPVLDALRGIGSAPGATLTLAQDGGVAPVRDEQIIALHATMPTFAGYLQVAYVQHDHTVAPLVPGPGYPAQTYPARGSIALGNKRPGSPGWLAGPPFGTDMIVAVASTAPLFAQPLPETQSLDAYLSALQAAVSALRRRGGTVAVTALPVETVPAR